MNILVRVPNWIGDAVMSLPALYELRANYPDARLSVLARPWVSPVYGELGIVDEILDYPAEYTTDHLGPRLRISALLPMADQLRSRGFQMAVLFQNAFEAALLAFLARIPERIGYRTQCRSFFLTRGARRRTRVIRPVRSFIARHLIALGLHVSPLRWREPGHRDHEAYYYLDLLYQTGLGPIDYLNDQNFRPLMRMVAGPEALEKADRLLAVHGLDPDDLMVVLNPGSAYGPAKRWIPERFAEVADKLIAEFSASVLILGWNEDLRIAQEIEERMRQRPTILSGSPDLQRTLGLLSRSQLLVTADSGPMHLAAGLGVPQVALFGSTDDAATGPLAENAIVIHEHAECSPCHLRSCPIDNRCWDRISSSQIIEASRSILRASACGRKAQT